MMSKQVTVLDSEALFPSLDGEKYYKSDIPRIDPEKKGIWTDALISDEYKDKQGKNMLKTPAGNFCCLGVYCDKLDVPEHEEYGTFRDEFTDAQVSGNIPAFGDKQLVSVGPAHSTPLYRTSSVVIPHGYHIDYIDTPEDSCRSWGSFRGEETIFCCVEQGPINDVTGEPALNEEYRRVRTYSLPNLNDTGFTFAQIRDVINYFL